MRSPVYHIDLWFCECPVTTAVDLVTCKSNGVILQIFHREKPCIPVQTGQLLDIVHTCEFNTCQAAYEIFSRCSVLLH